MDTQGERQNFSWRPNDNSSTTITRYELEAEHWHKAFKSAQMKDKKVSIGETFGVIGLFISLVFSLLTLVVLSVITFIKWLKAQKI